MEVVRLGNPILREVASSISDVDDPQIQTLIDEMLATTLATDGVGLAAPQVGRSLRLVVVASRPNPRYPDAPMMEPTAMANPRVVRYSDERLFGWEGCLSVPGKRGWIPRYREIEVEYWDRGGYLQRRVLQDFVARIFQHEFDHLEGLVFLDRVECPSHVVSEAEYWERLEQLDRDRELSDG
ncbi:MAG: peptide deformylase [Cyanobacteria bacterium SID2]|nr:peptide deformylase [Cyanobacteria bacterium SID2]